MTRRLIPDSERRARLVLRHHLARTAKDPLAVARGVVAMHSSDPLTPYLMSWARVPAFKVTALDDALYGPKKSLWRLHAMRRTLFVVPRDEADVFFAAAGHDVARAERKKLEAALAVEITERRLKRWVPDVEGKTLAALAEGQELRTQDLVARVPELATEITIGSGEYTQRTGLGSRLLMVLAMEGRIVRTRPAGTWRSSQYHWVHTRTFTGDDKIVGQQHPAAARLELARRYLAAHGPVTATDLRWWTGWPVKFVTTALAQLSAVTVMLEGGKEGYVLPDDVEPVAEAPSHVSLLPSLDSTIMGWKERGFYLGELAKPLFDQNGNAGPTLWVDGRVVGAWGQRGEAAGGEVATRLLADVGKAAEKKVAAEAKKLTTWLEGTPTIPRFRTPIERELSGV